MMYRTGRNPVAANGRRLGAGWGNTNVRGGVNA
jgi:hypothetical protein